MFSGMNRVRRNTGTIRSAYNRKQISAAKRAVYRNDRIPRNALSSIKRSREDIGASDAFQNVFYAVPLCNISRGDNLSQRTRDVIRVRGCRMSHWIRLDGTQDKFMRALVVRLKHSDGEQSASALGDNFFRGSTDNRSVNYDSISVHMHKMTYPVNTDKYEVLHDKLHHLRADASTKHKMLDTYTKCNRTCHFDNINASSSQNGIYYVYFFLDPNSASTAITTLAGRTSSTHITMFSDYV